MKLNLSQKLYLQDGKLYAYAEDIIKAVRGLNGEIEKMKSINEHGQTVIYLDDGLEETIDDIFGDKLK